ncbi:MAG: Glutamate 5-kinase [candidate division BRC1 bacterium ADurb.BinA364]|nr:MAG: Glutamate 5-kinase [candidate division BRC1 bacterium ADurb.BinA364]
MLSDLRDEGMEIIIVTSGAVGAGVGELDLPERPSNLIDEQALAAIGQSRLMGVYGQGFRQRGYHVAQILMTRGDLDDRRRHLNIRNCLTRLLEMGVIPIINENDTVSVDELSFGDNDSLSAIIASKTEADLLALLTDVDGLYDRDPKQNPDAQVVPVVESISAFVESMASATTSRLGSGGMRSKIDAARLATRAGVPVVIANGTNPRNLGRFLAGETVGTRFVPPTGAHLRGRERWIALGARTAGRKIVVDEGARRAILAKGSSLLPAGVVSVAGAFDKGDAVEICDQNGRCFAKGLSNFAASEIDLIKGKRSSDIASVLGEGRYDEVVHRDNLVVLDI